MVLYKGLSRNVLILGLVSFLTDFSSEMIFPLLPIFIITQLGGSRAILGVIEGFAESGSSFFKFFSGYYSDKTNIRKPLVVAGYSLSSFTKPLFAFVGSWPVALFLRFTERAGKGIRSSPRDSLIAFSADRNSRGKAFGFHRTMDNAGELFGPTLAALLLAAGLSTRQVFLTASIPAIIAVILLVFGVSEIPVGSKAVEEDKEGEPATGPLHWNRNFALFILYTAMISLAVFSKALLFPVAQDKGMPLAVIPLLYLASPVVSTLTAYPAGILSDRFGRKIVLMAGSVAYFIMSVVWIYADSAVGIIFAFGLLGLFGGLIEGQQRAFTVDLVPAYSRGTALGAYYAVSGVMILPGNIIAGSIYNFLGSAYMFIFAGLASLIALVVLFFIKKIDLS